MKTSLLPLLALSLLTCRALAVPGTEAKAPAEKAAPPAAVQTLGLKVEPFAVAGQVQNPTALTIDDQGRVYVTETFRWMHGIEDNRHHSYWVMDDLACNTVADRAKVYEKWKEKTGEGWFTTDTEKVVRLVDTDGDGKADEVKEFATNFKDSVDGPAIGLLPRDGKSVYLACVPNLWVLEDADGDGVSEKREALLSGFGVRTSLAGHDLHGLIWGPDGKLYFSMGDRGYNVKTKEGKTLADPGAGAVFRCNADGTGLEIFYYGLRNPQELAFNEKGDLFTVDNNSDQGDEARVSYLLEGGDTGWHMGHQILTTCKDFIKDGGFDQRPHWLAENLWKPNHEGQPLFILPPLAHLTNGPSGLVFTSGTSLPDRYRNSFLVCDYKGSQNQCFLYSWKAEAAGATYAMKDEHLFHSGVANVDVDFGADGKIYLVDFGGGWVRSDAGNVFTIFSPEGVKRPVVQETKQLFAEGLGGRTPEDLTKLLGHADWRMRQKAQFELVRRGEASATIFSALADRDKNLHGIWGLGQLKQAAMLRPLLDHADAEVRAQSARTLGDLRDGEAVTRLRQLLADEAPRVRVFAAIALGKIGDGSALPEVLAMIEKSGTGDPWERHAGVMAVQGVAPLSTLEQAKVHPVPAVRLSAVLALRRMHSPSIAGFLRDPDRAIAAEAVRAINDLPIPAAQPALAAEARRFFGQNPPALYQDEILFRRLLRANQVTGTPEAAANLAQLASHAGLSEAFRGLALRTLLNFTAPPPIDPTTGLHRPLPARDKAPLKATLAAPLEALLSLEPVALMPALLRVCGEFGLPLKPERLQSWASDEKMPLELRTSATEQLGLAARPLLESASPEVRAAAARVFTKLKPEDTEAVVKSLLPKGSESDLRTAYELLAPSTQPAAPVLLAEALTALVAGQIPVGAQLDLVEAAGQRSEAPVKEKLAAVEAWLASSQRTSYDLTLAGGDPVKGRGVFENQGTCLKCHRVGPIGGNAGPKLGSVALTRKPAELLQSLMNPNAVIEAGYGIAAVTLADGTVLTGTPLEETESTLSMRTPAGAIERLEKTKIKERTPPVSPMPPLGMVLSKRDLRDVLAYMQTLKEPIKEPAESSPSPPK